MDKHIIKFMLIFLLFTVCTFLGFIIGCAFEPKIDEISKNAMASEIIESEVQVIQVVDTDVIDALARTIWGEARGCSTEQQEAVVWCILNRVDSNVNYFPDDIMGVITQSNQFQGYNVNNPIEAELYELSLRVCTMWEAEKNGESINRVLPKEYLYFYGDGNVNYFTTEWLGEQTWNWGN